MTVDDERDRRINWTRNEVILACALLAENNWKWMDPSDPRAVELSELLRRSPEHPNGGRKAVFRNPNGVVRKMQDLQSRLPDYHGKPTHGGHIDREVLNDFLSHPTEMRLLASRIREIIHSGDVSYGTVAEVEADPELTAPEGSIVIAAHLKRERNPRLRAAKIRAAVVSNTSLSCEVCGFDFESAYGARGRGYIEVHHALPLHVSGETRTSLADLVLLCSNCHRMIHRGQKWLTPAELKTVVASTKERRTDAASTTRDTPQKSPDHEGAKMG